MPQLSIHEVVLKLTGSYSGDRPDIDPDIDQTDVSRLRQYKATSFHQMIRLKMVEYYSDSLASSGLMDQHTGLTSYIALFLTGL